MNGNGKLSSDWKVLLMQMTARYGVPTVVALVLGAAFIWQLRDMMLMFSSDLRSEQQFTREKLIGMHSDSIESRAQAIKSLDLQTKQVDSLEQAVRELSEQHQRNFDTLQRMNEERRPP